MYPHQNYQDYLVVVSSDTSVFNVLLAYPNHIAIFYQALTFTYFNFNFV